MKREDGQITVFLALLIAAVLALLCVTLEAGRSASADYVCGQAASSAMQSVFAAYNGDMLEEYSLLMCRGKEYGSTVWTESAREYAEKYLAPGAGTRFDASDRLGLTKLTVSETDAVYITERNGRVFYQETLAFMKSAGLSILIQEALSRLGLYNEEDGLTLISTLQGLIQDKDSSLEGILGSYEEIKEQVLSLQAPEEGEEGGEGESGGEEGGEGGSSGGGFSADLLEQLKAIWQNGLIAVVTGTETLSSYSYDRADLPSRLPDSEKGRHGGTGADLTIGEKFLLGEYLLHRMSCYTDQKKSGGRYEVEYVLTGKSTDKAALEVVVGELLLIRVGFNFAYLLTDAEKLAEAEALALTILSLLALPQLTAVVKWILVTAWAAAEAVADIRCLLKGEKVPLWKTASTWKLLGMSTEGEGSAAVFGLKYEDYLRLLFYLGKNDEQAYRMMDVMQCRVQLGDPGFLMKDHMVYAEARFEAEAAYLYIQAPAVSRLTGGAKSRNYKKEAAYGYGRR